MVIYIQIKGNNLIGQNNNYHSKSSAAKEEKNQKEKGNKRMMSRFIGRRFIYIMKIRTANDIREFNAALTNCKNEVWLMGANDESYNMKNEDEYIEGMIRLTEGHDDQLGIFTASVEDEITMMHFIEKMAA